MCQHTRCVRVEYTSQPNRKGEVTHMPGKPGWPKGRKRKAARYAAERGDQAGRGRNHRNRGEAGRGYRRQGDRAASAQPKPEFCQLRCSDEPPPGFSKLGRFARNDYPRSLAAADAGWQEVSEVICFSLGELDALPLEYKAQGWRTNRILISRTS